MKMRIFFSFILCSVIFIIKFESAQGQLIKDFFAKVHGAAEKVRHDIKKVIRPETKSTTNNNAIIFFDENDSRPSQITPSSTSTRKPAFSSTPSQFTTEADPGNSGFVFVDDNTNTLHTDTIPTSKPGNTAESIAFVTEKVPDSTGSNSTDNSGKENFSGGCLPGYLRSPDGRCMPTF